jgi:hypothetical protein
MGDSFVRLSMLPDLTGAAGAETTSSTIEAYDPHCGQRPKDLEVTLPHCWQTKRVWILGMGKL